MYLTLFPFQSFTSHPPPHQIPTYTHIKSTADTPLSPDPTPTHTPTDTPTQKTPEGGKLGASGGQYHLRLPSPTGGTSTESNGSDGGKATPNVDGQGMKGMGGEGACGESEAWDERGAGWERGAWGRVRGV